MSDMKLQIIDGTGINSDNKIHEGMRIHGSGKITKEWPNEQPTKPMCSGCSEDFYNGHNAIGVNECWSFKKARVVNKVGHSSIHCANGPDTKMVKTLSCWHGVSK